MQTVLFDRVLNSGHFGVRFVSTENLFNVKFELEKNSAPG